MALYHYTPLTAVLGPTNTGKTHLAIERMLAHSSGMIGLPLRLLAREVYDRVVRMKGADQVALVTGEERIWPATARYILSTTEAMPLDAIMPGIRAGEELGPVAFVAVDEVQLAQDPARGHVFTSRILHARGRDETMLLGSATITPVLGQLLPDAHITSRPRFSTLRYSGPEKLANLPPRTVIVAFSADEVYSIAEGLRRISGGAAVVMGALSPRTRNAQVAMFQSGEVDYLVATDAIGMGLNLDIDHVVFAGLHKFDGIESRRLTPPEMAQIAGRAGRHQRDGSFGSLSGHGVFSPDEVEAVEDHRFDPLPFVYWREPNPAMNSINALIADLEKAPTQPMLRSAPDASDLSVLRHMYDEGQCHAAADNPAMVRRLWDACSLPDFRKCGIEAHQRMVGHIWTSLSGGDGHIDADWFLGQLDALDTMDGPIEVLGDRIGAVRSYCYIAQRSDWLADPHAMGERARDVEARLSDAMHEALTARFVDRRTGVLMRALGQGAPPLAIEVDEAGVVSADGQVIGALDGFSFRVDPSASASDHKMLLATAEKYLCVELAKRASVLAASHEGNFTLSALPGKAPIIIWRDHVVATLARGKHLLSPRVILDPSLSVLDANVVAAVQSRLDAVVDGCIGRYLRPLVAMAARAQLGTTPPDERAILAALVDGCGIVERQELKNTMKQLDIGIRNSLRSLGVRFGFLDLFVPVLMKPMPLNWLTGLSAAWSGDGPFGQGQSSMVLIPHTSAPDAAILGYRIVGDMQLRVEAVEKMALHAHAARTGSPTILKKRHKSETLAPDFGDASAGSGADADAGAAAAAADGAEISAPLSADPPRQGAFHIDPELGISMGLSLERRLSLLGALGFHIIDMPGEMTVAVERDLWWIWDAGRASGGPPDRDKKVRKYRKRGRGQRVNAIAGGADGQPKGERPAMPQLSDQPVINNPFGALADMFTAKDSEQD
ncbi:MAG: helicase-related protein [Pseudomonadota bacterium]